MTSIMKEKVAFNEKIDSSSQENFNELFEKSMKNSHYNNVDNDYHNGNAIIDNTFYRPTREIQAECVLVCGPPGSGKTSWATENFEHVYSADDFMMKDGVYHFDPSKLSANHRRCEDQVMEALFEGKCVVYCNTNTAFTDFCNIMRKIKDSFYRKKNFSCKVRIVKMRELSVEELVERVSEKGNGHGVELYKLVNMTNRLKWLFNTFNPIYFSWCSLVSFKKFHELNHNNEMKFNGPYMPGPNSNFKKNTRPYNPRRNNRQFYGNKN
jgi:hypothetical protein